MYRMTVQVEGMLCSRCEDTVAGALRGKFPVEKVKASRRKKQVVLESKTPLDTEEVASCIRDAGYEAGEARTEEAVRKSRLFGK